MTDNAAVIERWQSDASVGVALIPVLLTLVLISGCAGNPDGVSGHRYLLGAKGGLPDAPAAENAHRLRVAPVHLAPFLRGDGIVMQTSEVAIHQGRDHLWAEALGTQLQRDLRRELARKLPEVRVLKGSDPEPRDERRHRLEVDVEAFQGRYDGVALVAGQWRLSSANGQLLISRHFSRERTLTADGYQALVESLAGAWRDVVDEIAAAVAASW